MSGHAKSDINVTPLIDIVLVLLIIFIVMVPGMSKSMPVVVPQVIKTEKIPVPDKIPPLVVEIDPTADNKAYVFKFQGEAMELGDLSGRLTPVVQLQPAGMRKVFVKVDEETPYQVAVQVLDQVRRASDQAKKETAAKPEWGGLDGGDIKVATSVKSRK